MRRFRAELIALAFLGVLPCLFFWQVLFAGRTLLPADNLFAFEPWRSFAAEFGATVPHNELLSDLILENYAWKQFIVESIQRRELPLWNPYLFAGVPFLAAGQHSAMYPFSVIFYVFPLTYAYGLFTALHFALASWGAYLLARVLGASRCGGLVAGIAYAFSAFYVVSVTFTMVIAAAAWLPFLLAILEVLVRKQEQKGLHLYSPVPYVAAGALLLGLEVMAGHVEMTYYTLMVAGFYALGRLLIFWRRTRWGWGAIRLGLWILILVALGLALGGVQLVPMYELVSQSFRQESASYQEVVGWAYPTRQILTFLIPNFFGNPSHHAYFDPFCLCWREVTHDFHGNPQHTLFWGIKNYVEAGSYVGILPLVLVGAGLVWCVWTRQKKVSPLAIFGVLAALALAFTFGTPLYAILYYGLPGYKQLHSPFRWVFPYTLSMAILAGWSATTLGERFRQTETPRVDRLWRVLAALCLTAGIGGLLALAGVLRWPGPFLHLSERVLLTSDLAQSAFASAQAFLAYQWGNLAWFFAALAGSGLVLWTNIRKCRFHLLRRELPLWQVLALILLVGDLFGVGMGFNPAADPRLLEFEPPAIGFLKGNADLFRFTTLNDPEEQKTLNANAGMPHHLQDVRGYDSIIPQQYADYMSLIAPQTDLLYNRIAPIYTSYASALDSPLLDLLGVRYVVTTQRVERAGYTLVYDEEVRIYRNERAMPRAFGLACTQVVPPGASFQTLRTHDPRHTVIVEKGQPLGELPGPYREDCTAAPALVTRYEPNEVEVQINARDVTWLVLADSYFPGWKAYVRPAGSGEEAEQEAPIYRVDGNFRGVILPAGEHLVRFRYTPMSFKLGLFASFMAWVCLFLLVANWIWGRLYQEAEGDSPVRRVAKNSLTPMALSLLNKGIDFAFAMLRLRILAPEGEGRYAFAINYIGYFEILTIFGLGTLLTREVAKDRSLANRYFNNTAVVRILLWMAVLPVLGLGILLYRRFGGLTADTATAIFLFTVALFFSNLSDVASAEFMAHEKMEYPAAISTLTTVLKVSLGAVVLILGWGFVGLAFVSVLGNLFTLSVLTVLLRRHCFKPRPGTELDWKFQAQMVNTSFPLMLNHLLATVFFRINILLLKPMKGDMVVGYYGAALKYIDGLNVIPSLFTIAIFPLMSRYAATAKETLYRAYVLSLRLLLLLAFPVAAGTPFIARELILLLGGSNFLPHAQIALQIVIFFFPLSCVNQVTQYVLIALDQQRFLTKAFAIGVAFNLVANLLLIPRFGYQGAALVAVLSELALLLPFYYCVRKNLQPLPWISLTWRPALASAGMALGMWLLRSLTPLLVVPLAGLIYLGLLTWFGAFRDRDMAALRDLIPRSWQPTALRLLPASWQSGSEDLKRY